jgi:uncharacterized protein with ParB-like and HNH nuclease domain
MSTIAELIAEIEKRELILPEFQRGFVWSPTKVKDYIESIYKNYPTDNHISKLKVNQLTLKVAMFVSCNH